MNELNQQAKILLFDRCHKCEKPRTGSTCGHCGYDHSEPFARSTDSVVERMVYVRENEKLQAQVDSLTSEVDRLKKELSKVKQEKLTLRNSIEAAAQDLVRVRNNMLNLHTILDG